MRAERWSQFLARLRVLLRLGWLLFLRDFRYRYRQTYLGYFWPVIRVLFASVPLILVGSHFNLGGDRIQVPYPVYALVGLIMWAVFWDSVTYPQWIGRRLRKTFAEVPFPREALLTAAGFYVMFNASIYLPLVGVSLVLFRVPPPPTIVLGLVALPMLILAGLSVGAMVAPLTFVYLDFRYGLPFLSSFLLWTAPIFYAPAEGGVLKVVNAWNPLTYLIAIPRTWFVSGFSGDGVKFLLCFAGFLVLLSFTLRFFRRAMPIALQCVTKA